MRIAVQNPSFIFDNQKKNFNGYNYQFIMKYVEVFYITDFRKLEEYKKWIHDFKREAEIVYSVGELNKKADVLMCFSGVPYSFFYKPPRRFRGLKIYHVMDYVFFPKKAANALNKADVQYIMAYCNHYKHDAFFRQYYSRFTEENIISVPFGYGERFTNNTVFSNRINKVIALGSVNPVNDLKGTILKEYSNYHKNEFFTHKLRRAVVENRDCWSDYIDDLLPTYPETKNPVYDPVEMLNKYSMFLNDAGLMNFPPARTYEGIASGCVMVAEDLGIWKDLGFVDGVNCILFEKGNYKEMIEKISYYQNHENELKNIQYCSLELSQEYSHNVVAEKLYSEVSKRYELHE